jgi:hypothetical protein
VSKTASVEPITCASCEYRYPPSVRICPMCGTEPLQPLLALPNKFSRASRKVKPSSSASQQRPPRLGLRRLIPVVAVSIALMAVTSLFYDVREGNLRKESGAPAELTATSAQPKLEKAGQRRSVHNPVRGVQQFVAGKLRTAQTIAAKEADPVELWKAVKRGGVNAEVALANVYLEGEAVPRNCEQAHMLLYAASMKGSKAADNLLKSGYPQRCERLAPSF